MGPQGSADLRQGDASGENVQRVGDPSYTLWERKQKKEIRKRGEFKEDRIEAGEQQCH